MLDGMSWDDQNLVLDIFGIGSQPSDPHREIPSLAMWLQQQASDTELIALGQHLGLLENEPATVLESNAEPEPLFVFASHLARERKFLGDVEAELKRYQVGMFVAHDSIPIDAEWNKEIVDALKEQGDR